MGGPDELPGALVVGAGPAGLAAAEVLAEAGMPVTLLEASPWPGRKLLVAGRGGLNLTHGEDPALFRTRFVGGKERWGELLAEFGPAELQAWATGLGVETYVGTSGRVFPVEGRASRLLRAWLARLRAGGVVLRTRVRVVGLVPGGVRLAGGEVLRSGAVVLALGGASWPRTGSDGSWVSWLAEAGVEVEPLVASNCGWVVAWPAEVLEEAEGLPLKNLAARVPGGSWERGELLVTRYGLEGGLLYRLGAALRGLEAPRLELDLKPDMAAEDLVRRFRGFRGKGSLPRRVAVAWKLKGAARALLRLVPGEGVEELAEGVKRVRVELRGPRPIAEAISTAGGVAWAELDEDLQLRRVPGVFVAGEMLAWDAPTGGYLLTGCLATGRRAGRGAAARLAG